MKQVLGVLALLLLIGCTVAERGDVLYITYTGSYTNGTVFDTNDPDYIGTFSKPAAQFTPLTVTLGRGQVVPGFEAALYGMREGETKEVLIKAKEAYGAYDAERVVAVPKHFSAPMTVDLPREVVVSRSELPGETAVGQSVSSENFVYNVTAQNSTHVTLYALNATRDPIRFAGTYWDSALIRTTPEAFIYRSIIENKTYSTDFGPYQAQGNGTHYVFTTTFVVGEQYTAAAGIGRATRETDTNIYIDFNHQLAGHDLVFNITIEEIERK